MSKYSNKEIPPTLWDRFGVGFLSAVCFLFTFYFCSFMFLVSGVGLAVLIITPLNVIALFTLLFFVLGFVTLDNYFVRIITPIWKFIDEALKR